MQKEGMLNMLSNTEMLNVAIEEAKIGFKEGGVPIGAALFSKDGKLLGKGLNRRVQNEDIGESCSTC